MWRKDENFFRQTTYYLRLNVLYFFHMDLCFLDLETTGFEPKEDSIIEVSFVRFKEGKKIAEYDQVMQPDKSPLNDFVSHLTGIREEEIAAEGVELITEKDHIRELIGDSVIVGHNIDFDIRFLIGNDIDVSQNPRLDTHELARILLPLEESFALEVLSEKYGFTHTDAHRAMSDVWASKDLFDLLLDKIKQLPAAYLEAVRPALENHTDWHAKRLFLEAKGVKQSDFYQRDRFYTPPIVPPDSLDLELSAETDYALPLGENQPSAQAFVQIAQQQAQAGKSVLIVSPKLDYFTDVPKFPTPEVLLDPTRLEQFAESRGQMDDLETTFYLQCQLRHQLGFRGVFFFDLFFKMRGMWQDVRVQSAADPLFSNLAKEKEGEPILAISPEAFFRFIDLPIFAGRTLLIDEAEITAEKLLHAPTKTLSFGSWLDSPDEPQATAAQFFITRFCQEVIEPKMGHQIGPFGAKILLEPGDRFPDFTDALADLLSPEDFSHWQSWLTDPVEKTTRWIQYFPDSGYLSWHVWHPDDWRNLKEKLGPFQKIIGHRYPFEAEENAFWRIFYGLEESEAKTLPQGAIAAEIVIPPDLVSQSSPEFNEYCSHKIAEVYRESDGALAVNFSSLDTLRHCHDELNQAFVDDENFAIFGEKISGGDGKMWQMVQKHLDKKLILCTQKMLSPVLASFPAKTLVVQKFPFSAPHPLLQKIETVMKQSGQSWWDIWVVPQLTANLHRRIGNFTALERVVWLDPRENSKWGKAVLRKIFSN